MDIWSRLIACSLQFCSKHSNCSCSLSAAPPGIEAKFSLPRLGVQEDIPYPRLFYRGMLLDLLSPIQLKRVLPFQQAGQDFRGHVIFKDLVITIFVKAQSILQICFAKFRETILVTCIDVPWEILQRKKKIKGPTNSQNDCKTSCPPLKGDQNQIIFIKFFFICSSL